MYLGISKLCISEFIQLLCLTEEDLGMLMSSVVVTVRMCWREGGKREQWMLVKGPKKGQLTLSMGPARVEICFFVQRATVPSKRVTFLHVYIYTFITANTLDTPKALAYPSKT